MGESTTVNRNKAINLKVGSQHSLSTTQLLESTSKNIMHRLLSCLNATKHSSPSHQCSFSNSFPVLLFIFYFYRTPRLSSLFPTESYALHQNSSETSFRPQDPTPTSNKNIIVIISEIISFLITIHYVSLL